MDDLGKLQLNHEGRLCNIVDIRAKENLPEDAETDDTIDEQEYEEI